MVDTIEQQDESQEERSSEYKWNRGEDGCDIHVELSKNLSCIEDRRMNLENCPLEDTGTHANLPTSRGRRDAGDLPSVPNFKLVSSG